MDILFKEEEYDSLNNITIDLANINELSISSLISEYREVMSNEIGLDILKQHELTSETGSNTRKNY